MGLHITRESFDDDEYEGFQRRLDDCLVVLAQLLARPGFGDGPRSIGAELEVHLVDADARPSAVNHRVVGESFDPRLTLEIDRFNLEVNTRPAPLAGRPFSALAEELRALIAETKRAAARHGARPVPVGILPTLTEADLQKSAISDMPRYRALSRALRRQRQGQPFALRIEGRDRLELLLDDVTAEGANASFQVHLRVPPAQFAATYNAAQLATGAVLAVAGNSPLFLGRRLWDETRVAIFRQAVDDRPDVEEDDWRPARVSFGHGWVRAGAFELFAEAVALHPPLLPVLAEEDPRTCLAAGGAPGLLELRLHQGTVWRWNRAIYDAADGGHVRIELRALPAGPTVDDMVANAAFLIGLTLALAPHMEAILPGLPFGQARRNFYCAAREGLDATLLWPTARGRAAVPRPASSLADSLLGDARDALVAAGVDSGEATRWLVPIERRLARGMTGARWLRAAYDVRRARAGEAQALRLVVEAYLAACDLGGCIADWPEPSG